MTVPRFFDDELMSDVVVGYRGLRVVFAPTHAHSIHTHHQRRTQPHTHTHACIAHINAPTNTKPQSQAHMRIYSHSDMPTHVYMYTGADTHANDRLSHT